MGLILGTQQETIFNYEKSGVASHNPDLHLKNQVRWILIQESSSKALSVIGNNRTKYDILQGKELLFKEWPEVKQDNFNNKCQDPECIQQKKAGS